MIGNKTDLRLMVFIFAAEILYFFVDSVNGVLINPSSARASIGFWGLAAFPLAPQILTGYPLVGIIVCVVLLFKGGFAAQKTLPSGPR